MAGGNVVHPPYTLAVNISLVEVSEENSAKRALGPGPKFLKARKMLR
jgi:hypothetical protein